MSHHHPGYVYRLIGKIENSRVKLTEWKRDRAEVVKYRNELIREDLAEERINPQADYEIEMISADWLA